MGFGSYNCSIARICAERGPSILHIYWLGTLPFCKDCRFELIFQADDVHHNPSRGHTWAMLNNFVKRLNCDGVIHLSDDGANWPRDAEAWAQEKHYPVSSVPAWNHSAVAKMTKK
eukprot:TRINITY_DN14118_c0_g2_i1.p1 TRINITY_DN14118_c0_g2~~TRINITY_DN14118_c0_g2_i1.p1  ORF type:complete len:115 (+),score=11.79 TRINITY_DN14118_c0_g2_i1:273-617(+)